MSTVKVLISQIILLSSVFCQHFFFFSCRGPFHTFIKTEMMSIYFILINSFVVPCSPSSYLSQSSVSFLIIVLLRISAISSLLWSFWTSLLYKIDFYSVSHAFFSFFFSVPLIHLLPLSIFFSSCSTFKSCVMKTWLFFACILIYLILYIWTLHCWWHLCSFFSNIFIEVLFCFLIIGPNCHYKYMGSMYHEQTYLIVLLNKVQLARLTQLHTILIKLGDVPDDSALALLG